MVSTLRKCAIAMGVVFLVLALADAWSIHSHAGVSGLKLFIVLAAGFMAGRMLGPVLPRWL
ncbi:MAG TPA: hypothetical protein VFM12_02920 [Gemmatimonadales bacterium]|jgi:hypothetical protein|nr:hypothetical protein [Gemmatimonadales bacterium]